jgi:hypothetical protein
MKEMGGIGRWALILLLLGNVYGGFAQDANTARAQHIYELFVAGQGDSIHAALNRELQEKPKDYHRRKHYQMKEQGQKAIHLETTETTLFCFHIL